MSNVSAKQFLSREHLKPKCVPMTVTGEVIVIVIAKEETASFIDPDGGCSCFWNDQTRVSTVTVPERRSDQNPERHSISKQISPRSPLATT